MKIIKIKFKFDSFITLLPIYHTTIILIYYKMIENESDGQGGLKHHIKVLVQKGVSLLKKKSEHEGLN